uniref:Uncharacterized protein n=1 Tax=Rhipicephalus zambeziensis TaxID=60191 RepID=A0A224YAE1_9ACAR
MWQITDTVCNVYEVKFHLVSFPQLSNEDRSCVKGSTPSFLSVFFLSSQMFSAQSFICTQMHHPHTLKSRTNIHILCKVHSVQQSERVLSEVPRSMKKK